MIGSKFKNVTEGISGALLTTIALVTSFLRPWYRKWGATDAEVDRSLPGDDLVAYPKGDYTHAITMVTDELIRTMVFSVARGMFR